MKNPCRELRELLAVNQADFGRLIGRSFQSVRAYEKHPSDIPADVIERIKSLAAERGHADWAVFLSSDEWRAVSVLQPGETLIGARQTEGPRPKLATTRDPATLHSMLDDILESEDPDAIQAVVPNLELFHKWVKLKGKNKAKRKRA
jgi:ParB-like chromosome segregation protein Spo0J